MVVRVVILDYSTPRKVANATGPKSYPETSLTVRAKGLDVGGRKRGAEWGRWITGKLDAIEAKQSEGCSKPKIAVCRLGECRYILRSSISSRPTSVGDDRSHHPIKWFWRVPHRFRESRQYQEKEAEGRASGHDKKLFEALRSLHALSHAQSLVCHS
jgi:hypothetical protein